MTPPKTSSSIPSTVPTNQIATLESLMMPELLNSTFHDRNNQRTLPFNRTHNSPPIPSPENNGRVRSQAEQLRLVSEILEEALVEVEETTSLWGSYHSVICSRPRSFDDTTAHEPASQ